MVWNLKPVMLMPFTLYVLDSHVSASLSVCLFLSTLLLPYGSDSSQQWNCEHRETGQWVTYCNYSWHKSRHKRELENGGIWGLISSFLKFMWCSGPDGKKRSFLGCCPACFVPVFMIRSKGQLVLDFETITKDYIWDMFVHFEIRRYRTHLLLLQQHMVGLLLCCSSL